VTQLVDYYDEKVWGSIYGNRYLLQREKKCISIISGYKKTISKVLDVGCGNGFFLTHIASSLNDGVEYYGVDYSMNSLKEARKIFPKGRFKQGDIEEGLPYKDNVFDLVYAAELVEHLQNPDLFFEEVNRIIKPGGKLVISTPNLCAWYNRILVLFGVQPIFYETSTRSPKIGSGLLRRIKKGTVPVGHVRIFTQRALSDHLEAAGFTVNCFKGANFASLPKALLFIDSLFSFYPRLSSNIICSATKDTKNINGN